MKASRVSFAAALAAGSVLVLSGTAFAHVGVQPGEATKGGYAVINFKVPNERDNASTTQLEVNFPIDQPLTSVMPQDVPGWTVKVEKSKLDKPLTVHGKQINEAVTKVTWSGGKIEAGKFQQFPVSVGKLPENADQMVLKAIQTYDNNEVVRWIEEAKEGAAEPQNPAPVLKLVAAKAGDDHHAAGDAKAGEAKSDDKAHDEAAKSGSDTTARALGIAGIVIGLGGVAFGIASRRRAS
ncbi:YcnI family protein [Streptomyces sp. NPDC060334]|uniref:YcnI family copper-binding membrane protein n=1 Tax=unclassified Streptomyces TaxID=2593676 RepID=UPI0006B05A27|nr:MULTISPECIES: YcnI family protein [unclassified Streptomyces]KOU39799.1 membrane protein [Streptomyces sp. WM4235]MCX5074398.1 YcnI family protein [Streptomyces sp. NBC_00424]MCX5154073.1 YcnI family protein [Streptomyces sp. NBC_00291]WUD42414.1 YcnI family protein [Streptomyces sp. NBC_00513]